MSDTEPQHPLAGRALSQLRKLADGNGLAPDRIALVKADEKIFVLEAVTRLTSECETKSVRYAGPVKGKDRQILSSNAALHEAVERKRQEFSSNPAVWLKAAIAELKTAAGEGWGLNDAKVTLPETSAVLAATGACGQCQGQSLIPCVTCGARGSVMCTQCQGRGRETCYHCNGRGEDPQKPGERCWQCEGTQYAPCRSCTVRNYAPGFVPCPACHGKRGIPCPDCRGTGRITEEIACEGTAVARFRLKKAGLPAGLNRALDRLGIVNLTKGHADIETYTPEEDEEIEARSKSESDRAVPALYYRARLPYADLRLNLNGHAATISVFGKRAVLLNVPPFLDDALELARENLARAAKGNAAIESATAARCVRDALALQASGKDKAADLRRIYFTGLSQDTAAEIMANARAALNRVTLKLRVVVAAMCIVFSTGVFYAAFFPPMSTRLMAGLSQRMEMALDIALPCVGMLTSWAVLGLSARMALGLHLPGLKFAIRQKTGKTGLVMMAAILIAYATMLALTPLKPSWIRGFFG